MAIPANLTTIGKVVATHGFRGIWIVKSSFPLDRLINRKELIWIVKDSKLVPFSISEIKQQKAGFYYLKSESINEASQAKEWVGCELRLSAPSNLEQMSLRAAFLYFKGWEVVNHEDQSFIGKITDIIESENNPLLVIDYLGHEVLCPIHEEIIKKYSAEHKNVYVTLPEGLLDVYLDTNPVQDDGE